VKVAIEIDDGHPLARASSSAASAAARNSSVSRWIVIHATAVVARIARPNGSSIPSSSSSTCARAVRATADG
jgi:hypothetical protein